MEKSCLILYSGGSDSTWVAFQAAQSFEHVHLLTLDRKGFFKTSEYTSERAQNLMRYFGKARFTHHIENIDSKHRHICLERYAHHLFRHRSLVTSLTFSKLSLHWAAVEFARKHSIPVVLDGSTDYMEMYPDQNPKIAKVAYSKLYSHFGLEYRCPLLHSDIDVERNLYEIGLNPVAHVRGTSLDRQVYYIEQVLLAHFLNYYLTLHGRQKYEERMARLYEEKVQYIISRLS